MEFPMAKSKFKTKKAAAKRFKVSGSGKIVRAHANKRHILTKKSSKRKRNLCGTSLMRDCDAQLVSPLIPYKF
jgi:large subunit ribosomal protein L35